MSAPARSARSTPEHVLDTGIAQLRDRARPFARLAPSAKADLVRACIPRVVAAASTWAERGPRAKDLPSGFAEEWLAGPLPTVRHLRLLAARDAQATFYRRSDPDGGVCVVLGAGNVSSIPPMDVLTQMFNEGLVCLLKVNPVNEWIGSVLEVALQPLIAAGSLRVVYGGADVGQYLAEHDGIDAIHFTGSARTHDAIVVG